MFGVLIEALRDIWFILVRAFKKFREKFHVAPKRHKRIVLAVILLILLSRFGLWILDGLPYWKSSGVVSWKHTPSGILVRTTTDRYLSNTFLQGIDSIFETTRDCLALDDLDFSDPGLFKKMKSLTVLDTQGPVFNISVVIFSVQPKGFYTLSKTLVVSGDDWERLFKHELVHAFLHKSRKAPIFADVLHISPAFKKCGPYQTKKVNNRPAAAGRFSILAYICI